MGEVKSALRSHVGRVRSINEDYGWVGQLQGGLSAAIVADGMGGHLAGEIASGLAVESLVQSLREWREDLSAKESEDRMREMIRKANEVVFNTASLNNRYRNMGTTVVVALLNEKEGIIGHIGDSRAYRIRGGQLSLITDDHTLVNELAKMGQLTPEEAQHHPRRNVLTRALGTERDVAIDIRRIDWMPGDQLLLCSDGLSGMVDDEALLSTMTDPSLDLEQKAERLVELALQAGGEDNVTVALVGYEPEEASGGSGGSANGGANGSAGGGPNGGANGSAGGGPNGGPEGGAEGMSA